MPYMNPYSESGFLDLLNSQQNPQMQPVTPANVEPTIQLGETEAFLFESQWTEAPSEDESTAKEPRKSRRKWSPLEDLVLISSWLNTSKDPIVGNEQKAEAFWSMIATYYASSRKLAGMEKRVPQHCKNRWAKINEQVCKFVGCYASATSQKTSGQNEDDVLKLANQLYLNDHKAKFTLEHCWRELRNDPKWCLSNGSGQLKKRRTDEGSPSSHVHVGCEGVRRPEGVKAAKAKAKKNASEASNKKGQNEVDVLECQNLLVLRKQDEELKQKTSKYKMLENLIGKQEPLSEGIKIKYDSDKL
ncbi:glutathione S-transferase T3-like [Eutrema salsugineum]|uniref:glutathione S-transferase T3-like n=1 Tax=Eutrema salsugineum TaxID=72664 RepID=UPI000CED04A9|nr:glutathione S-transferase T3-like [Eutrema salsugineum]